MLENAVMSRQCLFCVKYGDFCQSSIQFASCLKKVVLPSSQIIALPSLFGINCCLEFETVHHF